MLTSSHPGPQLLITAAAGPADCTRSGPPRVPSSDGCAGADVAKKRAGGEPAGELDWRTGAGYPSHLPLKLWAWEFLRRNPRYRAAYQAYVDTAAQVRAALEVPEDHLDPTEVAFYAWLQSGPGRFRDPLPPGVHRSGRTCQSLSGWLRIEWGFGRALLPIPDPRTPSGKVAISWGTSGARTRHLTADPPDLPFGTDEVRAVLSPTDHGIVYDLARPLGPQLQAAKAFLIAKQNRMIKAGSVEVSEAKPRSQVEMYPTYLRVLDALAECGAEDGPPGEALKAIADAFPDEDEEKNFRHWIKEARRLRDGGYRVLPSMSQPTQRVGKIVRRG